MASDDDLDAFFGEVDAAEEEAKRDLDNDDQQGTDDVEKSHEMEQATTAAVSSAPADNKPQPVVVTVAASAPTTYTKSDVISNNKRSSNGLIKPAAVVPTVVAPVGTAPIMNGMPTIGIGPAMTAPHFLPGMNIPPPPPPPPPPVVVANNATANTKVIKRTAAGQTWEDPTLQVWPENDYRLFVGNLAKDVHQSQLEEAFGKYPSFAMARVIYNKMDNTSKGFGFVSMLDPRDAAR